MFVDSAQIKVTAGRGGDGLCSFLRLLYNPNGGPDGGDGGHGGNVFIEATNNINTLYDYRSQKHFKAQNGVSGGKNNRKGKTGDDLVLKVPIGTQVQDMDGNIICDLKLNKARFCLAKGGRGGYGNAHFKAATRQAPKFAELGEGGENIEYKLELMLLADVGLVGKPSVGKSSLIASLTSCKPKVAAYEFTTLVPNLGVLDPARFGMSAESFVIADVPGIIEGASEGKGLGHQFLKHIKRTSALMLVVDADSLDVVADLKVIFVELETYQNDLSQRVSAIVVNKLDLLDEQSQELLDLQIKEAYPLFKNKLFFVSAATSQGLKELVAFLLTLEFDSSVNVEVDPAELEQTIQEFKVYQPHLSSKMNSVIVSQVGSREDEEYGEQVTIKLFEVKGARLEQIVQMSDPNNHEADSRINDVCKKMKVFAKMVALGAKPGDEFVIAERNFKYYG